MIAIATTLPFIKIVVRVQLSPVSLPSASDEWEISSLQQTLNGLAMREEGDL